MLSEEQINILPERIYTRLKRINTEYLKSIGEVIKDIGELRPSDAHKLQRMYQYGSNGKKMAEKLAEVCNANIKEIYEIYDIVAKENYNFYKPFYEFRKKPFIPYDENTELQNYVEALAKQTVNEYKNLTQHTAFAVFSDKKCKSIAPLFEANKNKAATSLSETYSSVIDYAVTKVQLGVTDYQSAMRGCLKALADSGIKTTADYASGYSKRLDSAVRQNILFGVKNLNQEIADMVGEEIGADGYEISYHSNPRPDHADMGGQLYAKGPGRTIKGINYPSIDTVQHLLDEYGCLHFKFSVILGLSEPTYSKKELAKLKANDNKPVVFEGKEITKYEASQKQRTLETAMRHCDDRLTIAKAADNEILILKETERMRQLQNKYHELSTASRLPTKWERTVSGLKTSKKPLTKGGSGGIMNMNRQTANVGLFSELQERMSKKHIRDVADECGISLKGLTLNIDKNEELLNTFLTGRADYENIGQITFFPNAFKSKEELIRTLYHEKTHVKQYKKYGTKYVQDNSMRFEKEAYDEEEELIKNLKERGIL